MPKQEQADTSQQGIRFPLACNTFRQWIILLSAAIQSTGRCPEVKDTPVCEFMLVGDPNQRETLKATAWCATILTG